MLGYSIFKSHNLLENMLLFLGNFLFLFEENHFNQKPFGYWRRLDYLFEWL